MFKYAASLPCHRPTSESTFETAPGSAAGEIAGDAAGLAGAAGLGAGVAAGFTGVGFSHAIAAIAAVVKTDNRTDLLNLLLMFIFMVRAIVSGWIDRLQTCGSFSRSSLVSGPAFLSILRCDQETDRSRKTPNAISDIQAVN
jgi:hypothetical protein